MRFFAKTKQNAGYLAVSFLHDGICATHIKRSTSAQPEVELFAFVPCNTTAFNSALEKLGKEIQAKRYRCGTMLAFNDYQMVSVDAPNVPPEELKTAVRWRLKDMLDYSVDDATIDVLDVPIDKNAATRNHSMYVLAARNQLIEQRQSLFAKSKVPLKVIDVPELAQRNISALVEPEMRGVAMLSFAEEGGLLTVTFGGELYLSRRIDMPLSQLQQSDADQRNACFDRITLELQRSLDHFDRQYHFITLAKLVLAPIPGAGNELREYLASNLYVPVESLSLDSVLNLSKVPELKSIEMQQRYFLALGAALREEAAS